jgi:hypothetical protein
MTPMTISRKTTGVVLCVLLAVLVPLAAIAMYAGSEGWVEQLTGFVVVQEGIASARASPDRSILMSAKSPWCEASMTGVTGKVRIWR